MLHVQILNTQPFMQAGGQQLALGAVVASWDPQVLTPHAVGH
jgi:hypothetical protein